MTQLPLAREPSPFDDGELYDLLLGDLSYDVEFYLRLAREAKGPILDVACGTGRLLFHCLRAGCDVEGLDLHHGMLSRLRSKAQELGRTINAYQSDMARFALPRRYALIMIPFNSFGHNVTQADQLSCLECCRSHLLPGGVLAMDTFFPGKEYICGAENVRVLEGEFPHPETGRPLRMYDTRTFDRVTQLQHSVIDIETEDAHGSAVLLQHSSTTVRWVYREEMGLLLRAAGFGDWRIDGDFLGRPLTQETDLMVVTARVAQSPSVPAVEP
jgi:SAM-dependent methyltransferase